MKNFDKILKESVEQFEVPFNDAHWAEMEARLNGIHSKKKNTLLFGSAATVIALLISAYFLTPTSSNINSEKNSQIIEISNEVNTPIEVKQEASVPEIKEETGNEKIESLIKIETNNSIKLTSVYKEEKEYKTEKLITPAIATKKQGDINKVKPLINNKNLKKEVEKPIQEKETSAISSKIVAKAKPAVKQPQTLPASKIKKIRHKAYEDENVSKKNIKRKRGSIFRFLSFKKRLYKFPLSKKKSSKKEKK